MFTERDKLEVLEREAMLAEPCLKPERDTEAWNLGGIPANEEDIEAYDA